MSKPRDIRQILAAQCPFCGTPLLGGAVILAHIRETVSEKRNVIDQVNTVTIVRCGECAVSSRVFLATSHGELRCVVAPIDVESPIEGSKLLHGKALPVSTDDVIGCAEMLNGAKFMRKMKVWATGKRKPRR